MPLATFQSGHLVDAEGALASFRAQQKEREANEKDWCDSVLAAVQGNDKVQIQRMLLHTEQQMARQQFLMGKGLRSASPMRMQNQQQSACAPAFGNGNTSVTFNFGAMPPGASYVASNGHPVYVAPDGTHHWQNNNICVQPSTRQPIYSSPPRVMTQD
eukprot:TRINITY_DN51786_c0_g1_i1.p1 TRINITY_DN51786_c0_g1~~TRINITY_DN51786_c0_g1_i1.p1  ORF type:complete len:158 (-),score=10.53 TRINITY_DN51786_c0_g1_i1:123-596(-)